ncbi:MAG: ROK family transcriptional regulator [Oscillospiraceae bacterium]|nr:ROK family transcriptional regulator [Oscillospiraceae bacterium]
MSEEIIKQDLASMLEYHRNLLLHLIRTLSPISRADLTRLTKLSPTTVGRIIGALIEEGLIIETGLSGAALGRKARQISINNNGCYAVGIDIGMDIVNVGVTNFGGELIYITSRSSGELLSVDMAVELIRDAYREVLEQLDEAVVQKILGIGVTVTGNVQPTTGIVQFSPQQKWSHVPLKDILVKELGVQKIYIDNDVKGTATAELLYGHGRSNPDFAILHAGTGVGTALVSNSHIVRSGNGLYGELGHTIYHPFGRLCDCGRRGCIQTDICIPALENEAGMNISRIIELAGKGDPRCSDLLETAERSLAILVNNMINTYDPPLILLEGELFDMIENLTERVIAQAKYFMNHGIGYITDTKVQPSSFSHKKDSVVSSAAVLFHNEFAF